jgi:hypothetical protein
MSIIDRLKQFAEMIADFCENRMEHINTLCGVDLKVCFNVTADGMYGPCFFKEVQISVISFLALHKLYSKTNAQKCRCYHRMCLPSYEPSDF